MLWRLCSTSPFKPSRTACSPLRAARFCVQNRLRNMDGVLSAAEAELSEAETQYRNLEVRRAPCLVFDIAVVVLDKRAGGIVVVVGVGLLCCIWIRAWRLLCVRCVAWVGMLVMIATAFNRSFVCQLNSRSRAKGCYQS